MRLDDYGKIWENVVGTSAPAPSLRSAILIPHVRWVNGPEILSRHTWNGSTGGGCICRNPLHLACWHVRTTSKCVLCVAYGDNEMESLLPRHRAAIKINLPGESIRFVPAKKRKRGVSFFMRGIMMTAIAFQIHNSPPLGYILAIQRRVAVTYT